MKLSDITCRKAVAADVAFKLSDGGGLFLHVAPSGRKSWRLSFRLQGQQTEMTIGTYPDISLLEARDKRQAARRLIAKGLDPRTGARRARREGAGLLQLTFGDFADLYLSRQVQAGRATPTLVKARWIVEDLAADLREMHVADIKPRDVLRVLRAVEAKGNRETARRMRGILSAVFRLAVIEQAIETDPTAPLRGALLPPQTRHHSAVTNPAQFGALLRVIDGYEGQTSIKIALQLLALTFPRPGELRLTQWNEVQLNDRVWTIPAERTKLRREHRIPLSEQALAKFTELRTITGKGLLCFPSIRSASSPLSDGALNAALRAMGVDGATHVAHGFRSSASSLLNEHSAFTPDVIERALAHGDPDTVRRAYNRAHYWEERVRMMQWWADYLDRLRAKPRGALEVTEREIQSEFDFG